MVPLDPRTLTLFTCPSAAAIRSACCARTITWPTEGLADKARTGRRTIGSPAIGISAFKSMPK